ncbi:type II secretion system protein N [Vibrio aestuarianus]|uniref:type II secretion system protein N n=1 Tax=Vibrio aestuarianus TaxID=28171 RepID=UPI00237D15D1|nr:type II secretion system protein N [Vibrio aestuarianus]MDE1340115.1 type II secretion system protein N [Vibrio aestuarianus]
MKHGWLYGGLSLLAFTTSLVAHIPASFVVSQAPMPPELRITGIAGTIWSGSAQQIFWQGQNIGDLKWDIQLSSLFVAKLEAAVRFGRGSDMGVRGKGNVGLSLSGPYAENLVLSAATKQLTAALVLPFPIDLQGQLELSLKQYQYSSPWCESAQGTLAWTDSKIGTPLGELSPGPVVADLTCQANDVALTGQQSSAQVSSDFSAQLKPDMNYSFQAWFKPEAQFPSEMGEQLKWVGNPDNQGRYQFQYQGQL